jgi:import inner membrane translocase subunit TIM21
MAAVAKVQEQTTAKQQAIDSLELTDEKISALTDQIPQKPMTVVETGGYSVVIVFAFGALIYVLWQFVSNFVIEPTAMRCFNHALERLKTDPRITVRLGGADEIRAWGSNSNSRVARQQIPHQIYKDAEGVEHCRVQFYMRGPQGTGQVHADMYKDRDGQWQYTYLLVDVYGGNSQTPSRVHIVSPR